MLLVSIIFLLHVRSALVAIVTLPIALLISFLLMYFLGVSANIQNPDDPKAILHYIFQEIDKYKRQNMS